MSVRVKKWSTNGTQQFEYTDSDSGQRHTSVDGYTFHWAPNEVRNFLDDGVGAAHAAFGAVGVGEDTIAFGTSRS